MDAKSPDIPLTETSAPELASESAAVVELTRNQKIRRALIWFFSGLGLLVFFTLLKFPYDRIYPRIQSEIDQQLEMQGLKLTSESFKLSLLTGLKLQWKGAKIGLLPLGGRPASESGTLELLTLKPAVTSMIFGKLSAKFWIEGKSGELSGQISMPSPQTSTDFQMELALQDFDLEGTRLTDALAGMKLGGSASGKAQFEGDFLVPNSLVGLADLSIKKLAFPAQSIQGIPLPAIKTGDSRIKVELSKGKLNIDTLEILPGGDLSLKVSGSAQLGNTWEASTLDLKANFKLSPQLLNTMGFLEAILGAAQQPDKSYSYTIGGTFVAPFPNPVLAQ